MSQRSSVACAPRRWRAAVAAARRLAVRLVVASAVALIATPSAVRASDAAPAQTTVTTSTTAAINALGEALFSDPRLSPDGRFSCASCHRPDAAFAEPGVARQRGRDGLPLATNAPSLIGLAPRGPFRHDGGAPTLAAQVVVPLLADNEMANRSLAAVAERLAGDPDVVAAFIVAFGGGPTGERVVTALVAHLRSLQAQATPYDRFRAGDRTALSPAAARGLALFRGPAGCAACHLLDGSFRDGRFHDTGIAARRSRRPFPDGLRPSEGRIAVTGQPADRYRVRTPGLRAVALTPPFMHDGSIRSLEAVVRYYAAGGAAHAGLSPLIAPFAVDDRDVADLVAFLEAVGGETPRGEFSGGEVLNAEGRPSAPVSAAPAE
jgi:cytochrome c peroxidase